MLFDVNLIQLVDFPTWSRIVNNVLRESILDHICVKDPTMVGRVHSTKPCFDDHMLILITLMLKKNAIEHCIELPKWRPSSSVI